MDALRHEAHAGLSRLASSGQTAKYRLCCDLVYYEYGLPFAGQARTDSIWTGDCSRYYRKEAGIACPSTHRFSAGSLGALVAVLEQLRIDTTDGLSLHLPPSVARELACRITEAGNALPKRGLEVCGLLLGDHSDKEFTVNSMIPMPCQYPQGPAFRMSEGELDANLRFAQTLGNVLGIYRSRNDGSLDLDDQDKLLIGLFSRQPIPVLVIRQQKEAPGEGRLLIWGDNVGVFSAGQQNALLLDERMVDLIKRILEKVEGLLTDSEKLRTSYGVRNLDTALERAVDYISSKSLKVFRISATRFWARNSSKLGPSSQLTRIARIKWAIYEKEKFQELINTLSDLIDTIFEFSNTAREIQDSVIIEDIESNLDVSQLAIIEEATESSYSAYSKADASVRAATETGTVDRRTLEERLRDAEGTGWPNFRNSLPVVDAGDLGTLSLFEYLKPVRLFIAYMRNE